MKKDILILPSSKRIEVVSKLILDFLASRSHTIYVIIAGHTDENKVVHYK